jgi:hypothetical protein
VRGGETLPSDIVSAINSGLVTLVVLAGAAVNRGAIAWTGSTAALDPSAPTIPTNLTANAVSASQINLFWTASIENVGILATGWSAAREQAAPVLPRLLPLQTRLKDTVANE